MLRQVHNTDDECLNEDVKDVNGTQDGSSVFNSVFRIAYGLPSVGVLYYSLVKEQDIDPRNSPFFRICP